MNNLTVFDKHLLIDIPLTEVNEKGRLFNDNVIKNISDDVELVNEKKVGHLSTLVNIDEYEKSFIIPEASREFSIVTKNYFYNAQRWIGHITKINSDGTFTAKLEDLTSSGTDEYAEFDNREVSEDDIEYLNIGNVFYWSVGYDVRNGQVFKESVLKFQRLPKLTNEEVANKIKNVDSAVDSVQDLIDNIVWD